MRRVTESGCILMLFGGGRCLLRERSVFWNKYWGGENFTAARKRGELLVGNGLDAVMGGDGKKKDRCM